MNLAFNTQVVLGTLYRVAKQLGHTIPNPVDRFVQLYLKVATQLSLHPNAEPLMLFLNAILDGEFDYIRDGDPLSNSELDIRERTVRRYLDLHRQPWVRWWSPYDEPPWPKHVYLPFPLE